MTDRLYYEDPYLTEFDAMIVERTTWRGQPAVRLDRTAFYPEGGGQPADHGMLSGVQVVDVQIDGDQLWHVLAEPLHDTAVRGRIDWARRFDFMQQHTGQHILSQAFIEVCRAETVSSHLGEEASTIDLNVADIGEEALRSAEALANRIVQENRTVQVHWVDRQELHRWPLRRPPKVEENIRLVEVSGFDWSPCGGTHVRHTGEVGLIKVVRAERRGAETRVTFLCGGRALRDYARKQEIVQGLMRDLSCGEDELQEIVRRRDAEIRSLRRALAEAEAALMRHEADALWRTARSVGNARLIGQVFDEMPIDRLRMLAKELVGRPSAVALLATRTPSPGLVFARGAEVDVDVAAVLRAALEVTGGRGGGRADWAQGGGGDPDRMEEALAAAERLAAVALSR
ncbi:MAG: DHHA1 domain-containing protein [Anaerolineae bacterium]